MKRRGILIVISGFSGAGKGTLVKELLKNYDNYALSVSMTTRQPREGERDGIEYFFSTKEAFEKELKDLEALYEKTTGQPMTKFYRPPQGKYNETNLQMAKDMGYRTFFWSLAYVDWYENDQPTREEAFEKLLGRIHPGAIVLLHSTSKTNGEILDELLTKWEEMGYHFDSLSNLPQ